MNLSQNSEKKISCVLEDDILAFLPKNVDESDITYKAYLHTNTLTAPVRENTVVGGVNYYFDGKIIGRGALIVDQSVEANSVLIFIEDMKDLLTSPIFILTVILFLFALMIYFILSRRTIKRRKIKKHRSNRRI